MTDNIKTITLTRKIYDKIFFVNRPGVDHLPFDIQEEDLFKSFKKALVELGIASDIHTIKVKRQFSYSIDYKVLFSPAATSSRTPYINQNSFT